MSTDYIRNAFLNLKDLLNIGFFIAMLNMLWLPLFITTPAFVLMLTMFSVVTIGLSIIQIKKFYNSTNSNIEGFIKVLLSEINIILLGIITAAMLIFTIAAVSLSLDLVATILIGYILVNAPLLLIISTGLTLVSQGLLLGLNLSRWSESPENSPQRSHYLQASFAAFFDTLTTAVILSTVLVLVFAPFVPFALPILAASSIFLTVANASWRVLSDDSKNNIKSFFGIEKPLIETSVCTVLNQSTPNSKPELIIANRGERLFTSPDHLSTIKGIEAKEWQKEYLLKVIGQKLAIYTRSSDSEKNNSKKNLLQQINSQLNGDKELTPINKQNAQNDQPKVFTSFWSEKGEIESITDAYNWYCEEMKPVRAFAP